MEIFQIDPPYDSRTHRRASTHQPDAPDPENNRIIRVWNVEPIPLGEVRAARKEALADIRWEHECGGITMPDGSVIATDDRSKTLLNGKYRTAEKYPDRFHRWKGTDGTEIALTSAQVIAIGDAVSDHVQACFDRELDLIAAIDAADTAEAVLAVDIAADWP
ncbi:protein of unknown function [Azospirillum oryzae]|uniref:DUF4376 domain-containing protein n=1 Tax=Azospirillum oryzae TaxID=286727 RepID=A0A1X7HB76_9PROT|nr:DUF4376 domain-containing protein [Azospirillum oryzae]SMF83189.1 protein of unknown function [Azospirillum oryzae]